MEAGISRSFVHLLSHLHHGYVVANRLDFRTPSRDDREHSCKDLRHVIGIDHEEEVVPRRVYPGTNHLIHILFESTEHGTEGLGNDSVVVRRASGFVMMVCYVKEHSLVPLVTRIDPF